jgi:RNA polymerase sigma-70 factor (ECF subfamily)
MPSNTLPDLVTRAQKGSTDAAGQLYERHYRSIFRYLFYRTGDQQAAEDLTGEVFLKMVQALPAYRVTSATFRTWLFQIARNLSIDHFRRSQTHPVVTLEEYIPDGEKAPESQADQRLTGARLQVALAQLKTEQRDVVVMRFVEEMPIGEVAAVLHKSEDAVKGLQRRALIALRDQLQASEDDHGSNG